MGEDTFFALRSGHYCKEGAKLNLRASLVAMTVGALFIASLSTLTMWAKPAEAAFPGKNGKIAFGANNQVYNAISTKIYTINPDGSGTSPLTNTRVGDEDPAFSSDGSKIAFTLYGQYPSDTTDIYVMNADGSGRTNLTPGPGDVGSPCWSPDGSKIAFVQHVGGAYPDGNYDIYTMNADGSAKTDITNSPTLNEGEPAWSPDGTKIAFSGGQTPFGKPDIYMMNADGSNPTMLTTSSTDNASDYSPAYSPDGKTIAFSSNRNKLIDGDNDYDIYSMNADGSGVKALTTDYNYIGYGNDRSPAFSPDGKKIVYTEDDTGGNHQAMYVMNSDGSDKTPLGGTTDDTLSAHSPDWQPNTAPVITSRRPAPDSSTTDRTPAIAAKVSDTQTDLSKTDIRLRLDGKAVARKNFSYDQNTNKLRYVPSSNLSFGTHEVRVTVHDDVGLGKTQTWSFKIVR